MTTRSHMHARIAHLERVTGSGRACLTCGAGGHERDLQFVLHTSPVAPAASQPCPACGHVPITFTLNIGPPLMQQEHHS
jgi:hypothetical protein